MILHPLFVHFPIALLTLYGVMEIISWRRVTELHFWKPTKAILVVLGLLGGAASFVTGGLIEEMFHGTSLDKVVHAHEFWAGATMWFFGIIAALYLIEYIKISDWFLSKKETLPKLAELILIIQAKLFKRTILVALAILGLIAITVTGALGGGMVHGSNADPLVKFLFNIYGF